MRLDDFDLKKYGDNRQATDACELIRELSPLYIETSHEHGVNTLETSSSSSSSGYHPKTLKGAFSFLVVLSSVPWIS
jgi:hypothetical protein